MSVLSEDYIKAILNAVGVICKSKSEHFYLKRFGFDSSTRQKKFAGKYEIVNGCNPPGHSPFGWGQLLQWCHHVLHSSGNLWWAGFNWAIWLDVRCEKNSWGTNFLRTDLQRWCHKNSRQCKFGQFPVRAINLNLVLTCLIGEKKYYYWIAHSDKTIFWSLFYSNQGGTALWIFKLFQMINLFY